MLLREQYSQTIPFTGRVAVKQFVQDKPNFAGAKALCCCSASVARHFKIYQRKGTSISIEKKHIDSIVMRLTEDVPKQRNFNCYFDNFTSISLLYELKKIGICIKLILLTLEEKLPGHPVH